VSAARDDVWVITIGDELLRGEIIDSNKSFLSQRLLTLDVETRWHVTCADDRDDMRETFLRAAARSDVVLVSGGLGPTRDDLTTEVLAQSFERRLVLDEGSLETIRAFLRARRMPSRNFSGMPSLSATVRAATSPPS
jgi:nicotinamide-nucleotide amidase